MIRDSPPFNPGGPAKAIMLANGTVLTAGELYDPIAGTFSLGAG
jgi:hypothetical protein